MVIVWLLDLQLSVQSVPITINVVSSNLVHHEVYSMQQYMIKFVSNLRQVGGFLNITEILFKVVLITINQTKNTGDHHNVHQSQKQNLRYSFIRLSPLSCFIRYFESSLTFLCKLGALKGFICYYLEILKIRIYIW